jgi:threonine dehydratase
VFLKAENLQRVGAFKFRGAYNAISSLGPEALARGVCACSSGNHAQAVALAARLCGTRATILMPHDAPASKLAATEGYGAQVIGYDRYCENREELIGALAAERGLHLVHPFDDPLVMAGAGTVALELLQDAGELDLLLVPVGGGGLISGVATAVKALSPNARVIGVEPATISTLATSLAAGLPVPRPAGVSVADALGPPSIGTGPLAVLKELLDEVVVVSEEQIAEGFRFLYARAKLAVEPAAAAPVAALLAGLVDPLPGTVLVLSGGNVSPEVAAKLLAG